MVEQIAVRGGPATSAIERIRHFNCRIHDVGRKVSFPIMSLFDGPGKVQFKDTVYWKFKMMLDHCKKQRAIVVT